MKKKSESPENSGKIQGNQFKPGQSGNPSGKPKGAKNHATRLAETLLDSRVKELVGKCVEMALEGDGQAMKVCMDRLIAPRKDRPVAINFPKIEKASDVTEASSRITEYVGIGTITPLEAQLLASVVEAHRKNLETANLEQRLQKLEERVNK